MADGTVHNYRYAQLAHARIFLCKLSISVTAQNYMQKWCMPLCYCQIFTLIIMWPPKLY